MTVSCGWFITLYLLCAPASTAGGGGDVHVVGPAKEDAGLQLVWHEEATIINSAAISILSTAAHPHQQVA
jgi:hypothetical protein